MPGVIDTKGDEERDAVALRVTPQLPQGLPGGIESNVRRRHPRGPELTKVLHS